ncbi:MAG: hydroxymethylglutaryl-CoA lyase [Actinobacteria bacterium]|nr:hydroxymethylglutaryl-CoA lyase [Actinomycetota bacterium]
MTQAVEIVEVGPRDGLQNERSVLAVDDRVALVERTVGAGVRRVEVTSFVSAARVPQMAGAEEVCAALPRRDDVSFSGLVLNHRGLQRALACAIDEVNLVVVATDEFSLANQGCTTAEMLALVADLAPAARSEGLRVTVTIAGAFGCPFAGEVPVACVAHIAEVVAAAGLDELSLADTIGVAVPTDVIERVREVRAAVGDLPLRLHLHNTRNTGYANAVAAVGAGVPTLDASVGGFGGCPFAPAATGNIATEDLAWMLQRMGLSTGVDASALAATGAWLGDLLGELPPALLGRAGLFPG